jgi:hypothetical protein
MAKNKVLKAPAAKKPNAAQRINNLERAVAAYGEDLKNLITQINDVLKKTKEDVAHDINVLAKESDSLAEKIRVSAQRSFFTAQAAGVEKDVEQLMMDASIKELKEKVQELVKAKVLVLDNTAPITDQTFVVGRQLDADGNVVNARLQFAVATMDKTIQDKLLDKKVGDSVIFEEGQPSFEPTEIYVIQEIKKEFENKDEKLTEVKDEKTTEAETLSTEDNSEKA